MIDLTLRLFIDWLIKLKCEGVYFVAGAAMKKRHFTIKLSGDDVFA